MGKKCYKCRAAVHIGKPCPTSRPPKGPPKRATQKEKLEYLFGPSPPHSPSTQITPSPRVQKFATWRLASMDSRSIPILHVCDHTHKKNPRRILPSATPWDKELQLISQYYAIPDLLSPIPDIRASHDSTFKKTTAFYCLSPPHSARPKNESEGRKDLQTLELGILQRARQRQSIPNTGNEDYHTSDATAKSTFRRRRDRFNKIYFNNPYVSISNGNSNH